MHCLWGHLGMRVFHHLPRVVVELVASFQVAQRVVEKGDQRELHLKASIFSRKD